MDATARRRWIGALALLGALAMLVAGETFLQGRLGAFGFLIFWLLCLGLTSVAIFAALLDFRAVQFRSREEQRRLVETTLEKIQFDAKLGRPGNLENLKPTDKDAPQHQNGNGDLRKNPGERKRN
jgi:hypothetical protein